MENTNQKTIGSRELVTAADNVARATALDARIAFRKAACAAARAASLWSTAARAMRTAAAAQHDLAVAVKAHGIPEL
jgi:hypothetical protein